MHTSSKKPNQEHGKDICGYHRCHGELCGSPVSLKTSSSAIGENQLASNTRQISTDLSELGIEFVGNAIFSLTDKKKILTLINVHPKDMSAFKNKLHTSFTERGINLTGLTLEEIKKDSGLCSKLIEVKKIISNESNFYLEKFGLGKGPFKFIGAISGPDRSLQESNPEAYNRALMDMPKIDTGRGSCARCATAISEHYLIRSSDGKTAALGSECIKYLNSKEVEDQAVNAKQKIDRGKRAVIADKKRLEFKTIISDPAHVETLKGMSHKMPTDYDQWDQGKREWYDAKVKQESYYLDLVERSKRSGKAGMARILKEVQLALGLRKK
jgi:hypothetical protein